MHRPRYRIFSSFSFLNITQFMGALNDNIFKLVIVFLLIGIRGESDSSIILAIVGAVYVAPFLLFSIPSGTLADRFSKRNITLFTKVMEVVVMSLGVWAFAARSEWGSYTILFLMATQSAIFGPSKYGIVPELVRRDQLSTANGILTGLTVLATILGTFLASFLTQITDRFYVGVALFCVLISFIGLIASICIERTPAMGIKRKLSARMITGVVKVLVRARRENYLFISILGSSYFFMVGAYTQLNIITFTIESLGLSDIEGGYLFLVSAFGIAVGAFISGKICGRQVELGVSALSGLGVSSFFFLLAVFQHDIILVVTFLCVLGIFGGMFLVPFDAYIQAASPDRERGENVAAANWLSFFFILIASALIYIFSNVFDMTAAEGFAWMGVFTLVLAVGLAIRLRDTFVRLASRLNFHHRRHIEIRGEELITIRTPVAYITLVENWEVGLLTMTTLEQRYMRFMVEHPHRKLTVDEWFLAFFGKVSFYDGAVPLPDSKAFAWGQRALKRGYSLSLITRHAPTSDERVLLKTLCSEMAQDLDLTILEASIVAKPTRARGHITPDMSVTLTQP